MQLRPLCDADRPALAALDTTVRCAARATLRIEGDDTFSWRPRSITPRQKSYRFDVGRAAADTIVAAADDGTVLGAASTTSHPWSRRTVLDELCVDRDRRRQGAGRLLITACLQRAADDGARHLWLETQDVNCEAIAFYERLGFAIVGVDRSLYPPPIADEVAVFMTRGVR